MKTMREIQEIIRRHPWDSISAHVHTHLCDGQSDMTVENIGRAAEDSGIELVILVPHFHKQVSDATETLYSDSDQAIFPKLRAEIDAYKVNGGKTEFLLSTEADILAEDGTISLTPNAEALEALDLITPTLNYHPLLPLKFVHLTYGRDVDGLHESGEYAKAAEEAGGLPKIIEAIYTTEANAILHCPYPCMVGHFLAAHSIAKDKNSWFGMRAEDMPIMRSGAEKLLEVCQTKQAIVDVTGLHPMPDETSLHKAQKDGFLYDFQRWFLEECNRRGILYVSGSDAHSLDGVGHIDVYRDLFGDCYPYGRK